MLQDVIEEVVGKAHAVQKTLDPAVRVLLEREVTCLADLESLRLEEFSQVPPPEMPVVPRHIEMEPVTSCEFGLETFEIGDRNHEQTAGPKKLPTLGEHSRRVRKVLQNVPDVDDVERVRGPGSSEHVAHEDRVSEKAPG